MQAVTVEIPHKSAGIGAALRAAYGNDVALPPEMTKCLKLLDETRH